MEFIARELSAGLPLVLLNASDLQLMSESEESLHDKTVWKLGLEEKLETKVMFGCGMKDGAEE